MLVFFLDVFLSNWINIGQFVVAFNSNYSIYRTWPSLFNKTILEWHLFIFNKTKFCRLKKTTILVEIGQKNAFLCVNALYLNMGDTFNHCKAFILCGISAFQTTSIWNVRADCRALDSAYVRFDMCSRDVRFIYVQSKYRQVQP